MPRNKKVVYTLLVAGAGSALLIDRAFAPSAASAAGPAASTKSATHAKPEDADAIIGPALAAIFDADRLASPYASTPIPSGAVAARDLFAASPEMRKHYQTESAQQQERKQKEQAKAEADRRQAAEAFRRDHRLEGIMLTENGAWAIIDGRILQPGDTLGPFVLRNIEHYRVVFSDGETEIRLSLPQAPVPQVAPPGSR
jgi:hypothetical protein